MALKLEIDWDTPAGISDQYLLIGFNGGNPVQTDSLGTSASHYEVTPAGNANTCEVTRYAVYGEEPQMMGYTTYEIVKGQLSEVRVKAACT